jgi:hypothetical protein
MDATPAPGSVDQQASVWCQEERCLSSIACVSSRSDAAPAFGEMAGISRIAECCESQCFLEDHEQADLLDAWYHRYRRVSAEQFGDTAGV